MATEAEGKAANISRRGFLKVAAVSAATAAGFLAAAAFDSKEGVKSASAKLGEGYGEGASLVASCGMDPGHCGGGGGSCAVMLNCGGGGGACGVGVYCSGS